MPEVHLDDTIAAIATPMGEGGIAVIRVSGPEAFGRVQRIFSSSQKKKLNQLKSHTIHFGKIATSKKEMIDHVLVSLFREPHSYTGQDVIEISCHGGLAVTKRILGILLKEGIRHAEPGEFTQRAFLNGKLDLPQAEAVLDLIKSRSTRSLDIAVRQLEGALSNKLHLLKNSLMRLLAHMEAYLDFPEEGLEVDVSSSMHKEILSLEEQIKALVASFSRNLLVREGMLATIIGKPNVGKSSLFNALLERDRALVSDWPYTTRDPLEEALEIQGFYIRLMDTAGLVSTPGHPLDKLGMERTLKSLEASHLVLYLVDGSSGLDETDQHVFKQIPSGKEILTVVNKADLKEKLQEEKLAFLIGHKNWLKVSTKTRHGLAELEMRLGEFMTEKTSEEGEQITRMRHKLALENALGALKRAEESWKKQVSLEFITLDIRAALNALQELIGEVYSEELLDMIFSEFCVGK